MFPTNPTCTYVSWFLGKLKNHWHKWMKGTNALDLNCKIPYFSILMRFLDCSYKCTVKLDISIGKSGQVGKQKSLHWASPLWFMIINWSIILTAQTRSKVDIHDVARWQFCNTTQEPCFTAISIMFMAIGPWPCPRDKELNLDPPKPCRDIPC